MYTEPFRTTVLQLYSRYRVRVKVSKLPIIFFFKGGGGGERKKECLYILVGFS